MASRPDDRTSTEHAGKPRRRASDAVGSLLAGTRIRKKLIILHTSFSLVMAGILGLALRPAVREVVERAEIHEATLVAQLAALRGDDAAWLAGDQTNISVRVGSSSDVGLSATERSSLANPRESITDDAGAAVGETAGVRSLVLDRQGDSEEHVRRVAVFDPRSGRYAVASVRLDAARRAVVRLYILMTIALLAVYALIAAALEIFVLPQHVYEPIGRLLEADQAVQEGRRDEELISDGAMPRDELGEIMRSRNRVIRTMRQHEMDLGAALRRFEEVATDLKRKNHLLETARRNLADADRLASLGVMSAGLAHEMNTPLTVLKGLTERLAQLGDAAEPAASGPTTDVATAGAPSTLSRSEIELMVRVVKRLEKLSESLLDFARVRPAQMSRVDLGGLVDEAWTLVRLDRHAHDVEFRNRVPVGTWVSCDADRILQVVVNLARNAVDAMESQSGARTIEVASSRVERDGAHWMSLTISDSGPGIDPDVLPNLFEPFVSTRLDSRGSGLGLAVSEGIVSEHGGLLLARNRMDRGGAMFEILLPNPADPPPKNNGSRP
ncbi:MAG: sensor histidine kinase [Phycisphaerales bacterium]